METRKSIGIVAVGVAAVAAVVIPLAACRGGATYANGTLTVKGVRYEMVAIPAGEFRMGSEHGLANEKPVHSVQVSAFRLGGTEVTRGLWRAVMGNDPSTWHKTGDEYPVESVSWDDCQAFLTKLNRMTSGRFRLPTEAEWEYACRADTTSDQYGALDAVAWYEHTARSTEVVGKKQANAFGLYDMLGNVWEWCQDYGSDGNFSQSPPTSDPQGPSSGSTRICRGGGFFSDASLVRASYRPAIPPTMRDDKTGLRLAASEQR